MGIVRREYVLSAMLVCVSGCRGAHPRPPDVPSSAVWVDHAFVDCSVDRQSKANRCTVYKDVSGEVLAEGLFLLNTSHAAADKSELRYAAFGHGINYLQDARLLVPWVASERDPSRRIIDERLRALASSGSKQPIRCQTAETSTSDGADSECALRAFASRQPFYIRFYWQDFDSFGYRGLAGDENQNLYEVDYDSAGWMNQRPIEGQLLDNNHTFVVPCRRPVSLVKNTDGTLACSHSTD
jgi:hypothetical protein